MPSAWHTPDDPREYGDGPVTLTCDACGRPYPSHPDDIDDETRLCVRCTARAANTNDVAWPQTAA